MLLLPRIYLCKTDNFTAVLTVLMAWTALCLPASAFRPSGEIAERHAITKEIQKLWFSKDFEALNQLTAQWRRDRTRTQSGFWKLELFYRTIDELQHPADISDYPTGFNWQRVDSWSESLPRSGTPSIVKASLLLIQAQKDRSWDLADKVRTLPWRPNPDLLKAAREILEENKTMAAIDPHWHTVHLRLMRLEGRSDEDILLAHAEALEAHPLYEQTNFELFDYFIDRWSPNFKAIDGLANTVTQITRKMTGMSAYARMYQWATPKLRHGQYYAMQNRDWNKMNAGLEQVNRDFPSQWNTHQYAMHACIAQDRQTAMAQFARADDNQAHLAWDDAIMFKQCNAWASPTP